MRLQIDSMDVFDLVRDLRPFRSCTDEPVSREDLGKILESGKHAPSPGSAQCMEFIVVESDESLEDLAEAAGDERAEDSAVAVLVLEDYERMSRAVGSSADAPCMAEATVVAQNMRLVARDLGISSVWLTGFDDSLVRQQFRVPDSKMVAGLVLLGRSEDEIEPEEKFALNEITFYEEYDNQFSSQFDQLTWKGTRRTKPATGRRKDDLISRIKRKLGII
jgi:nitroreductase